MKNIFFLLIIIHNFLLDIRVRIKLENLMRKNKKCPTIYFIDISIILTSYNQCSFYKMKIFTSLIK